MGFRLDSEARVLIASFVPSPAGTNIDDMAMQCELTATNHVQVGNKKRGHIVGGRVQAMLSITAKILGSPSRVATQLEIGVNPEAQKQAQELARNRDGKENRLLELSKLLAFAAANPGRVSPEMIERARATAASLSAEIQSLPMRKRSSRARSSCRKMPGSSRSKPCTKA